MQLYTWNNIKMVDQSLSKISLKALQSSNRAEFARLVDAYTPQIHRLVLKMLGNTQDAEDVLQNTFLKALEHIHTFEGRSSLSTWLYRIATNEALMLIRKRRPEVSLPGSNQEDGESDGFAPNPLVDFCCLPEEELLSCESQAFLDRAIQDLPEILRIVFLLRDIEGLSIQETSEVLDISETAVKSRLLRARLKLRERLSDYFHERVKRREANE